MRKLSARKKKWIERTVKNNRNYKLYLYNRLFIFLLFALCQVVAYALLFLAFAYDSSIGVLVQTVVSVLAVVFVLRLINRYDRASSKLSWIIIILIFPVFGVPMYLFNGGGRPTRKMQKRIESAKAELQKTLGEVEIPAPATRTDAITHYIAKSGGYPVYHDGEVQYFDSGESAFSQMLNSLNKAEKFILVEYFIIAHGKMWNEVLQILLEKASQGVQVRIIYDDFGCMVTLPPRYDEYLESLSPNLKCLAFNSVVPLFAVRMNNRDHRKLLVVDGKVAFTGGINLADEYIGEKRRFGHWKDSALKVTGNSVRSFTQMFFYIWNAFRKDKEDITKFLAPAIKNNDSANLTVQPYDDCPLDRISVGESVYADMIDRAEKYIWIFTPYLVLDDYMRASLCQASLRGVDVRIVTPGIPDKKMVYRLTRANYEILLKAGVKIYEYTPGFIHSKSIVSDDNSAVVGTINLDYRSLYHHFENAVYFSGCDAVQAVKTDCERTFAVSELRTIENTKRGFVGRLVDSILRVFETWM